MKNNIARSRAGKAFLAMALSCVALPVYAQQMIGSTGGTQMDADMGLPKVLLPKKPSLPASATGADNLGNHIATQPLQMQNYPVLGMVTQEDDPSSAVNMDTLERYLAGIGGDDLGNHLATRLLVMGNHHIVGLPDSYEMQNDAAVSIGTLKRYLAEIDFPGDNLGNHTATRAVLLDDNSIYTGEITGYEEGSGNAIITGGMVIGGTKISGLTLPQAASDAANKQYVDQMIGGIPEPTPATTYAPGDGITFIAGNPQQIAVNATVVRTSGNQTIAGSKTFTDVTVFRANTEMRNAGIKFYTDDAHSADISDFNGMRLKILSLTDGSPLNGLDLLRNGRIVPLANGYFYSDGKRIEGVGDPIHPDDAVNLRSLQTAIDGVATPAPYTGSNGVVVNATTRVISADNTVVRTSGAQAIDGVKTFGRVLVVSTDANEGLWFRTAGGVIKTNLQPYAPDNSTRLHNYDAGGSLTTTLGLMADGLIKPTIGRFDGNNQRISMVADPVNPQDAVNLRTLQALAVGDNLGNHMASQTLAMGGFKITGLGDATITTDTDAVNVKTLKAYVTAAAVTYSAGSGVSINASNVISVNGTVVRTTGDQLIAGNKGFSSPVTTRSDGPVGFVQRTTSGVLKSEVTNFGGELQINNMAPDGTTVVASLALTAGGAITPYAGWFHANDKRITNVADPVNPLDAVNLRTLQARGGDNLGDHKATQDLDMGYKKVINLLYPAAEFDAANKGYVDSAITTVAARTYNAGDGISINQGTRVVSVDNTVVRTSGDQDINGYKTFLAPPIIRTPTPGINFISNPDGVRRFEMVGFHDFSFHLRGFDETSTQRSALVFQPFGEIEIGQGRLNISNKPVINVPDPINPQDAVNLRTLQALAGDNLGNHKATQNLNMNQFKVVLVADPTDPQDAVNLRTLQAQAGDNLGNHRATQDVDMANFKVGGLADPVGLQDAVNLRYLNIALSAYGKYKAGTGISFGAADASGFIPIGVDATVVRVSGDQTINGNKNFTRNVLISSDAATGVIFRSAANVQKSALLPAIDGSLQMINYAAGGASITGELRITSAGRITAQTGNFDAGNKVISTVADPVNPQDAVNLRTLQAAASSGSGAKYKAGDGVAFGVADASGFVPIGVNATVVRTSGAQTIAGSKTFTDVTVFDNHLQMRGGNIEFLEDGIPTADIDDYLGLQLKVRDPANTNLSLNGLRLQTDGAIMPLLNGYFDANWSTIRHVSNPISGMDAVNLQTLNARLAALPSGAADNLGNHTATQALNANNFKVINVTDATAAQDALNLRTAQARFVPLMTNGASLTIDLRLYNAGGNPTTTFGTLTVQGPIVTPRTVSAQSYITTSDMRLKNSIATIPNVSGLDLVRKLRPVTYVMSVDGSKASGLIAQEVKTVMPDAVAENTQGYLGVEYTQMIAPMIAAIKALDDRVTAIEANPNIKTPK